MASSPLSQPTNSTENDFNRTKVLLLGFRRSGKTSIQEVLFENLNPKQSFYIETTMKLTTHHFDSMIPLEIWDCPGTVTLGTIGAPISSFASIIYVIDILDSYTQTISRFIEFAVAAFQENPEVNLDVFVHKAEAVSDDFRRENYRLIQQRISDELSDLPPIVLTIPSASIANLQTSSSVAGTSQTREMAPEQIPINYHMTSIYDHSLHDSFARIMLRLLANTSLSYLEELLNTFCTNSHASKAFIFDTNGGFYVATDTSPVDKETHSLCCEYLCTLKSFAALYRSNATPPSSHPRRSGLKTPSPPPSSPSTSTSPTHTSPNSPSSSTSRTSTRKSTDSKSAASSSSIPPPATPLTPTISEPKPTFYASSSITLANHFAIIYYVISSRLALVAAIPVTVWQSKRGLVEYNVVFLREGVQEIYAVEMDSRKRKKPGTSPPGLTSPMNSAGLMSRGARK